MLRALLSPLANKLGTRFVRIAVPDTVACHDYKVQVWLDRDLFYIGKGRHLMLPSLVHIPVRPTLLLGLGLRRR